jgi:hypothetical protein
MRINYLEKLLEEERSKANKKGGGLSPAAISTPAKDIAKEKEVLQKEVRIIFLIPFYAATQYQT